MYVSDHQGGDLSDIIRSAGHANQSETDTWKIPESIQQLPTDIKFDTDIDDSLLSSCFESGSEIYNVGNEMMIKRPTSNIFSTVLQVSPVKPLPMVVGVDGERTVKIDPGVQMSSSRVPGMIKRRKNLAKKVVCIPAPAAANSSSSSRPSSGEVVPSDLWAWRKYGQKPIKGSPFPRGYYRCSSSKGCSARKQVERSRTDPNMLVITYTSEHNHPWPTQRNVLAGSTRSTYPSKTQRPNPNSNSNSSTNLNVVGDSKVTNTMAGMEEVSNMNLESDDKLKFYDANSEHIELSDDLFADLAELESDPMSLIFEKTEQEETDKSSILDIFDWGESSLSEDYSKKNLQ